VARRFDARLAQVVAYVEAASEADVRALVPADGRRLDVILYHVAVAFSFHRRFFKAVADGDWQPFTEEWVDAANAAADAGHADAPMDELLDQLKGRGSKLVESMSQLSDAELDQSIEFRAGDAPRSMEQVIEDEVFGHVNEHLGSLVPA
jgi:hypothetical protein